MRTIQRSGHPIPQTDSLSVWPGVRFKSQLGYRQHAFRALGLRCKGVFLPMPVCMSLCVSVYVCVCVCLYLCVCLRHLHAYKCLASTFSVWSLYSVGRCLGLYKAPWINYSG